MIEKGDVFSARHGQAAIASGPDAAVGLGDDSQSIVVLEVKWFQESQRIIRASIIDDYHFVIFKCLGENCLERQRKERCAFVSWNDNRDPWHGKSVLA
jgi:hypothetical protein